MTQKQFSAALFAIIALVMIFIAIDTGNKNSRKKSATNIKGVETDTVSAINWHVYSSFRTDQPGLKSVAVCYNGHIVTGGAGFLSMYNPELIPVWSISTGEDTITALNTRDNTIFAATPDRILLFDLKGNKVDTWGPFMPGSYITSVTSNSNHVVIADAINKTVLVVNNNGSVNYIIGRGENNFIIPSLYFDVFIDHDDNIYIANTGRKRIEKHRPDGKLISWFGESGTNPEGFAGCCNPSHFTLFKDGFVTAEKGINRIKILDFDGNFKEFVSLKNEFLPGIPLDVAAGEDGVIYAANPADSRIYVFKRK